MGLLLAIGAAVWSPAGAQSVGAPGSTPSHWTPAPPSARLSAGFAWQSQVLGPSALAELSGHAQGLPGVAPQTTQLVLGASLRTGQRSALSLQTPIATRTPLGEGRIEPPSQMELAWSLRSRDPAQKWLGGGSPLRMALANGQTVVTLKPRARKLSITLQHQW